MSDFGKINAQAEHQRIREMLSVYIDEELPSGDRARVEEHLAGCADCAWEVETLRQTVDLVERLPKVPVPRAFTIHATQRPRRIGLFQAGWAYTYLKGATALAAALLILVLAGDALFQFLQTTASFAPARELAAPATAPAAIVSQGEGLEEEAEFAPQPAPREEKAPTLRDYAASAGATAIPLTAPAPSVSKPEATGTPTPAAAMEAPQAPVMLAVVPTASPQPRMTIVAPLAAPLPPSAAPTATPVPTATLLRMAKAPVEVRPTEESVLASRPASPQVPRLLRVVEASLCLLVMALVAATLILRGRQ